MKVNDFVSAHDLLMIENIPCIRKNTKRPKSIQRTKHTQIHLCEQFISINKFQSTREITHVYNRMIEQVLIDFT